MIHIKTILLAVCAIAMSAMNATSQTLTEQQKTLLQERIVSKVDEFQHSLSKIVDTSNSHKARTEHYGLLMHLFIGECEPYSYWDEGLKKKVPNTGVKMQTSSVNRTYKSTQLMKKYITKLYDPSTGKSKMSYTKIEIDSVGAVRVDNIENVGDHYECVAYFCQMFKGYRDGRLWYADVTTKKVRCFIKKIDVGGGGGTVWDAKLGDIYVLSTKRIGVK